VPEQSSIYDLGYRHYEGQRVGRRGTLRTLHVHSLRTAFGLGRRTSSKVFPFGLAVIAFVPAIIQLGVGAIVSGLEHDIEVFKNEDYFTYVRVILVLFCAVVAPELVGRDQRTRTLSLYFSRAVSPLDAAALALTLRRLRRVTA
jgi:ABC-2 type transport system permease protein